MVITTNVREWPIIMSGDSVRAIMTGTKVQTRRPVSLANSTVDGCPPSRKYWPFQLFDHAKPHTKSTLMMVLVGYADAPPDVNLEVPFVHPGDPAHWTIEDRPWNRIRPKWEVGDRLWCRESARLSGLHGGFGGRTETVRIEYRVPFADGNRTQAFRRDDPGPFDFGRWTSPIFLPKWAARLILEITDIKVERLTSISEADAIAEGAEPFFFGEYGPVDLDRSPARANFRRAWDKLNGRRAGCSWADNPWIWCLSFKKIEI